MALFIPGMRCAISGRPIHSSDEKISFPPFVANEADPIYVFSDASVHIDVFRSHPLASRVLSRLEEARHRAAPENRRCLICGEIVTNYNEHVGLGYLVDDPNHPLSRFNYACFHRAHLAQWPERGNLIADLRTLDNSGMWKGNGLKRLIQILESVDE